VTNRVVLRLSLGRTSLLADNFLIGCHDRPDSVLFWGARGVRIHMAIFQGEQGGAIKTRHNAQSGMMEVRETDSEANQEIDLRNFGTETEN